jgi:pyruvate/2-oxoglutarate dehydrogenase complex dihydrolipoamide acyltransferase (E2) component
MERNAVLAKTAKGLDEIKSRTHGLAQKLRSILIMVDGTATAGDILARFGGIPDVEAALETLVGQGFVEPKGAKAAAAAPGASAAPSKAPAAASPQTREQAMSALARYLIDNLGPDADDLTARLERARTGVEFVAAAERCADMLGAIRGQAKAQSFRDRAKAFEQQFLAGR